MKQDKHVHGGSAAGLYCVWREPESVKGPSCSDFDSVSGSLSGEMTSQKFRVVSSLKSHPGKPTILKISGSYNISNMQSQLLLVANNIQNQEAPHSIYADQEQPVFNIIFDHKGKLQGKFCDSIKNYDFSDSDSVFKGDMLQF